MTPVDYLAHQAPYPLEFSRQEYWSGWPFPSPVESSWSRDQTLGMSQFRQVLDCLRHQGSPLTANQSKPVLNVHWKDWCWSWNSNPLATWREELIHLKRPWCWERLRAGGEGDDRGWDGWMASPTQWTWVWVNSGSWWWTGKPGCCSPWGHKLGSDMTEQLIWQGLKSKMRQ